MIKKSNKKYKLVLFILKQKVAKGLKKYKKRLKKTLLFKKKEYTTYSSKDKMQRSIIENTINEQKQLYLYF